MALKIILANQNVKKIKTIEKVTVSNSISYR